MASQNTGTYSGGYSSTITVIEGYGTLEYTTTTANDKVTVEWSLKSSIKAKTRNSTPEMTTWAVVGSCSLSNSPVRVTQRVNASKGGTLGTLPITSGTATLSRTHTARTETVSFSVSNETFAKSVSGSVSISVPARPSYAVTYNANGGTSAPANQTKWYGENLTLQSAKPTRAGYKFLRWNTKADDTGTSYNSGASYTGNAALTLYAIWEVESMVTLYDANGVKRAGLVKVYDSNGNLRDCIISIYDVNGNKKQIT